MKTPRPPGPGRLETLNVMRLFRKGDIDALDALHARFGAIAYLRAPIDAYVVFDPELMTNILQHDYRNYTKSKNYAQLEFVLGKGLVTSDGDAWLAQRRQLAKMFVGDAVNSYLQLVQPTINEWADNLFATTAGAPFDATNTFGELAVGLSSTLLFGYAPNVGDAELRAALDVASLAAVRRIYALARVPRWIPTRANRNEHAARQRIDRYVNSRRLAVLPGSTCVVNALAATSPSISANALRDQLVTLMVAGQDTMLAALAWLVHCISLRQDLQVVIRQEAQRNHASNATWVLDHMPTARACVLEALRLWPPIPIIARTPTKDVTLREYSVPQGSIVLCALRAAQRAPGRMQTPLAFAPERFGQELRSADLLAFGLGPRRCIGEKLAIAELVATLCALVVRGTITPTPSATPTAYTTIAMKPKHGTHIVVSRHAEQYA
jgi:cytochrome P450